MVEEVQHNSVAGEAPGGIRVQVTDLSRVFEGGVRALEDISLQIPAGQFVSILGPSGCGKSTLLRMIAGLDQPTSGQLRLEGESDENHLGYVFQDPQLMPWRRLVENVALPLELRGVSRRERRRRAHAAIVRVGLEEATGLYPNQLSGGMRMRASLARALIMRPRLLLLDEPFAALDELTRHRLHQQLLDVWRDSGMTVLFVTHSVAEATFLSQRAIVMSRRPGRIIHDALIPLPQPRRPSLRGTAAFATATAPLYEALEQGGA